MQIPSATGQPAPGTPQTSSWLDHLGRGTYLRAHLSAFAVGSVTVLGLDLLTGGGIWADAVIGAWGVLIVAHGIAMIIARLLPELLGEDEEDAIRPASEVQWQQPSSTWSLPPRVVGRVEEAAASPTPDAAGQEHAAATERVSWQAATNAAWLAPKDAAPDPGAIAGPPPPDETPGDKDDDFTPLKFD